MDFMELELDYDQPTPQRPQPKRRRSRLEPLLLLAFILCLLIGLGALGAMLWLTTSSAPQATRPALSTVRDTKIAPRLALHQLAGDSAVPLAYQAVEAGELETALSIISFDPQVTGRERSSLYRRLARRTEELGVEQESIALYETMRTIAVLDPRLTTNERLQLLIGSTTGLIAAQQMDKALDSAQQAKRVAAQSPDMLPAQRNRHFETLLPLARRIDNEQFLQQIEEFERNPYVAPTGQLLPLKLDQFSSAIELPPEIANATTVRQQSSRQLIERLTNDPNAMANARANQLPEQQALTNALLQEDAARTAHFQSATAGALSLQQQYALLENRQSWLALKLRTAQRGFGLPLVTEWEEDQASILAELSGVTQNIGPAVEALMNLESLPQTKAALRVEKLLQLALLSELGLYPGTTPAQFRTEIRFAQDEAQKQGIPLALRIIFETTTSSTGYQILDAIEQP